MRSHSWKGNPGPQSMRKLSHVAPTSPSRSGRSVRSEGAGSSLHHVRQPKTEQKRRRQNIGRDSFGRLIRQCAMCLKYSSDPSPLRRNRKKDQGRYPWRHYKIGKRSDDAAGPAADPADDTSNFGDHGTAIADDEDTIALKPGEVLNPCGALCLICFNVYRLSGS